MPFNDSCLLQAAASTEKVTEQSPPSGTESLTSYQQVQKEVDVASYQNQCCYDLMHSSNTLFPYTLNASFPLHLSIFNFILMELNATLLRHCLPARKKEVSVTVIKTIKYWGESESQGQYSWFWKPHFPLWLRTVQGQEPILLLTVQPVY